MTTVFETTPVVAPRWQQANNGSINPALEGMRTEAKPNLDVPGEMVCAVLDQLKER